MTSTRSVASRSSSSARASSASRAESADSTRLAHRVERHAGLAVAHLAQRELQRALATEIADAHLVELGERPRLGSGGECLLLEVVGIHDGDLIQRFLLLSRARERGRSRPGSCRRRRRPSRRRRPGNEPGRRKGEDARAQTSPRYYPPMSEYDAWAPGLRRVGLRHDRGRRALRLARARGGRADRRADGRHRTRRDRGRRARPGSRVLGIDSSPAMLDDRARARRRACRSSCGSATCASSSSTQPAALIYVPCRSLLHLHGWQEKRAVFERVAASLRPGRAVRVQRLRLQPHDRGAARRDDARPERRRAHAALRSGRQSDRDRPRRRRDAPPLVGDEGGVGRPDRRRRARGRGALRRFRARAVHDESLEFVYVTRKP